MNSWRTYKNGFQGVNLGVDFHWESSSRQSVVPTCSFNQSRPVQLIAAHGWTFILIEKLLNCELL